jgi:nitrogen regulatory protein P-II 1
VRATRPTGVLRFGWMKSVEAWVTPARLEDITERLRLIGIPGMTVQAVKDPTGPPKVEAYRGSVLTTNLLPRLRILIVVPDDLVESVINAVSTVVRREPEDDGWIVVHPLDDVIRIRTGEHGPDAL